MNSCLKLAPQVEPTPLTVKYTGKITEYDQKSQNWIVDGVFKAACALSLLVKPCVGDNVCFIELDNQYYIVQLLSRQNRGGELLLESQQKVHWVAPELRFTAFDRLELVSLNKVAVMGKDYVMTATNTMIHQAEKLIQQVGQFSLTAKGLLRLNGKQQVITAEKDVRIDGKRINMG
ncbi:MAG: DUF3540 domain-containing protein [Algicola sp.]|nr:DUF3540 domain-containing protein [Algicola sp.]